jgi:hypothetical protein
MQKIEESQNSAGKEIKKKKKRKKARKQESKREGIRCVLRR